MAHIGRGFPSKAIVQRGPVGLVATIDLAGASNGTSTVTGALTVIGANNLAGTIVGVSMVTPDLDTIVLFTRANVSTVPRIG